MERNSLFSSENAIRLIDRITSSQGNFFDASVANIIKNDKEAGEMIKLLYDNYQIEVVDENKTLQLKYNELSNALKQIEELIGKKFSCFKDAYLYISNENKKCNKAYMFLREERIKELELKYIPIYTLQTIGWTGTVESFIDQYGVKYLLALSRLYEGEEWHDKAYSFYKSLIFSDFEKRKIEIIHIDNKHIIPEKAYMDRVPIWEDKIGGSIFVYGVDNDIRPMRFISKYYHYIKELELHSNILRFYGENGLFENQFINYFLESEDSNVGFYEPHCLMEACCWEYSIEEMKKMICREGLVSNNDFSGRKIYMDSGYNYVLTDNIIDCISNDYNNRQFPGNHRMFSMDLKYFLFKSKLDGISFEDFIVKNADKREL